jgi:hypothetical protein
VALPSATTLVRYFDAVRLGAFLTWASSQSGERFTKQEQSDLVAFLRSL